MSQSESPAEKFEFLTEEDLERMREYAEDIQDSWTLLGDREEAVKPVRCLSCANVFKVPKHSTRAYCPDSCGGRSKGHAIESVTKEVACVDCGEWFTAPKFGTGAFCDSCRKERNIASTSK